jgi:uncharacterized protein YuzE
MIGVVEQAMTVTIGSLTFDHATYDDRGDVLYLHIGERQAAADSEATPEGHVLRFNDRSEIIGLTIIDVKRLLQHDHAINITVPRQVVVSPDALSESLTAT